MGNMAEHDWQVLRKIAHTALERYCRKTLDLVDEVLRSTHASDHGKYLDLYGLLQKRDKAMADAFSDIRRSQGETQLAMLVSMGLVNSGELAEFSENLRAKIKVLLGDSLASR